MIEQSTINFECYEDAKSFLGITNVTLPDVDFLTQEMSGVGIAGKVQVPIIGHLNAMTAKLDFRQTSRESLRLQEPREHNIDLRAAVQVYDKVTGTYKAQSFKHVMVMVPITLATGKVAPASTMDGSGTYAVRRWVWYIDGEKVLEVDPYNCICEMNGVDYLAETRKALGRA